MIRTLAACLVAFLLLLPTQVFASVSPLGEYGKIAGRVLDAATGEPLIGVNVIIEGTTQGGQTDVDGYYTIIRLRPGTYRVQASFIGFATTLVENVQVVADQTTRVDIRLREEVIEGEEVVVIAERPIVQMDRTTTTATVNAEQIEALPVASLGEVISYQAGVVADPDGSLHFRGGRSGEVAYLVNGVPINNAFSNTASFDVEQNMVESLEVISGVFNAEYGQATSGVVNIITKDVPDRWSGNVLGYVGALATGREVEFLNRTGGPSNPEDVTTLLPAEAFTSDKVSLSEAAAFPNLTDVQLSLGGPLFSDRFGVQLSGRYFRDQSFLFARDLFSPGDVSFTIPTDDSPGAVGINTRNDPSLWLIGSSGDGEFHALNTTERYSLNGTVSYVTGPTKVSYNIFVQEGTYTPYSHNYKYVPRGLNTIDFFNQTHIVGLRHSFGNKSFASLSYSYLRDFSENKLYESPFDERHVDPSLGSQQGSFAFQIGGNDLFQSEDQTQTHTIVGDYTLQANRIHLFKTGFSARFHQIDNHGFGIGSLLGFTPQPTDNEFANDTLSVSPFEFAVYLQDKMEFEGLIVNAGLRLDYFDPDYQVPVDWIQADTLLISDPNNPGQTISNRRDAKTRMQISPRLGLAFPISSNGVMRFSAGMFFQVPAFSLLYTNSEYEIDPSAASNQLGNPELEPERTLAFEVGLQQGITDALGLEFTLYSKDVRNLTGQEIVRTTRGDFAVRWVNIDYGTIRGLTLALFQRPQRNNPLSWTLDYTLQFSEGTASSPGEAFGREQSGLERITRLTRLDWDRRHSLNTTVTYAPSQALSFSLVTRLLSGTPYTTERNQQQSIIKNNGEKPLQLFTDLRVYAKPPFIQQDVQLFLEVRNLFDYDVENNIYADTGTASNTATQARLEETNTRPGGLNSLDEWFFRQEWFGAPRRVSVGLNLSF